MTEDRRDPRLRIFAHRNVEDHTSRGIRLARRGFLGSGLAVAGLALGMRPAAAVDGSLTQEGFAIDPPGVPEREGVLSWRTLAKVSGDGRSEPYRVAPEVEALDGTMVTVDGFMMPYDDQPRQREFLLTAYQAHCPFCMPGGMPSIIDVDTDLPMEVSTDIVTVRGRLTVLHGEGYGLLYRMRHAAPA